MGRKDLKLLSIRERITAVAADADNGKLNSVEPYDILAGDQKTNKSHFTPVPWSVYLSSPLIIYLIICTQCCCIIIFSHSDRIKNLSVVLRFFCLQQCVRACVCVHVRMSGFNNKLVVCDWFVFWGPYYLQKN